MARRLKLGKRPQALSQHDGMKDEPVFVDELGTGQGLSETRAPVREQFSAGLLFEVSDLFLETSGDDARFIPLPLLEASGEYDLGNLIHRRVRKVPSRSANGRPCPGRSRCP